jgi:hypothetical protein
MELHAVDEGVIVDRAGVGSASRKGLKVGLSRPCEILVGDRGERRSSISSISIITAPLRYEGQR